MALNLQLSLSDRLKLIADKYRPLEIKGDEDVMTNLKLAKRRTFLAIAAGLTAVLAPQVAAAGPTLSSPSQANIVITSSGDPGLPGQSQAGNTFHITARVPLACWVRPDSDIVAQNGSAGGVLEACNNPGGFTVTANYRPLSSNERAEIFYNDRAFDLDQTGTQILRRSPIATIKRVNYRFGTVDVEYPLVLSLVIQPI